MPTASAFDQHLVELINRFRLDPAGEYERIVADTGGRRAHDPDVTAALRWFGVDLRTLERELDALDPVQPLAWNGRLAAAATGHSQVLRRADVQSHQVTSRGEAPLGERIRDAGYDPIRAGENVYSYAESGRHAHEAFVVDWGPAADGMQAGRGHRVNLVYAGFSEVGIGALRQDDASASTGPWIVTQNFAARADAGPFLTGVAYRDRDGDGAYSMGEGMKGLKVAAEGRGQAASAKAGGWSLEVGEGEAALALSGAAVKGRIALSVEVGRDNVKLDLVDRAMVATSADLDLKRGGAGAIALGIGDVDLSGKGGRDRLQGNAGRNALDGEGGADHLSGGAGRDRIEGGRGDDVLKGGGGADLFVFHARDGHDRVLDWGPGDAIALGGRLERSDAALSASGDDAVLRVAGTVVVIEDAAGRIDLDDLLLV
ncbi:CAP domain-containing protein [Albimonas pacifica]|uniref:Cysteine-rich secretory protein family protein n=1 Tax=Albimonas pacifica TaxID=1114924 RepID=A0A1I3LY19_9RHOB|nr:CAP domain-containing protein [Albimonas pacifica]SFI89669.1 Cysteine-rich secretory protein family protein [Albimonas pacifica]